MITDDDVRCRSVDDVDVFVFFWTRKASKRPLAFLRRQTKRMDETRSLGVTRKEIVNDERKNERKRA